MDLYVPDVTPADSTLEAATHYALAGWYVLPIRGKVPAVKRGEDWTQLSTRDPQTIAGWFAGTDLGVALHAGRSGAVVIDIDYPDWVPDPLIRAIQTTQAPWQGTRKTGTRGHVLFRRPPGRRIGNSRGKLLHPVHGKKWGEVRGTNGYIVVAPSVHVDPAGLYQWHRAGPVPELPDYVAALLPDQGRTGAIVDDAEVRAFLDRHVSDDKPWLLDPVIEKFEADMEDGSRHEALITALPWAMREAQCGYYPARVAADTIQAKFVAALQDTAGRSPQDEFHAALAWSIGQALVDDPAKRRQNLLERKPPRPVASVAVEL